MLVVVAGGGGGGGGVVAGAAAEEEGAEEERDHLHGAEKKELESKRKVLKFHTKIFSIKK